MTERPIMFKGPMVRAILDGTKTQTRRVAKLTAGGHVKEPGGHRRWHPADPEAVLACPYGQPGDRLWVREGFAIDAAAHAPDGHYGLTYLADGTWIEMDYSEIDERRLTPGKKYPSIYMPRWASRLLLEIVAVRVERVREISEGDCIAEGIEDLGDGVGKMETARGASYSMVLSLFAALWDSINAKRGHGWTTNPWVWVVEFKVCSSEKET